MAREVVVCDCGREIELDVAPGQAGPDLTCEACGRRVPSPPALEREAAGPGVAPPPIDIGAPPTEPPSRPTSRGSFRLFRLARTDVFVHWSWFVAAYFRYGERDIPYSSLAWAAAEYVGGFGLVLLHEFGHVLACRSVGGKADRVILW